MTSGWPAWPISTISQALLVMRSRLNMHLGDQRAGGIEVEHVAGLGGCRHRLRHPVCRKDHGGIGFGDLVQLLHKNGAFGLQGLHHVTVVDDLVAHIDGRPELLQRQFDDLDGAVDTGTKAARGRHENGERATQAFGAAGLNWAMKSAACSPLVHVPRAWPDLLFALDLRIAGLWAREPSAARWVGNTGPQETGQVFGQGRCDAIGL